MTPEIQVFAQTILTEAIRLCLPILIAALALAAEKARQYFKSKLSGEQLFVIETVVGISVRAAEQSGLVGLILNTGEAKKEYALKAAQELLASRGMSNINVAELAVHIEAAIREGLQNRPASGELVVSSIR